jgi:hypothetical protein
MRNKSSFTGLAIYLVLLLCVTLIVAAVIYKDSARVIPSRGIVVDALANTPLSNIELIHAIPLYTNNMDWGETANDRINYSWGDVQRVRTDAKGRFAFDKDDAQASILFLGSEKHSRLLIPASERKRHLGRDGELRINLQPGASLSGVCTRGGRPISGAFLNIGAGPGKVQRMSQNFEDLVTDAQGHFEWTSLAPGTYHVGLSEEVEDRILSRASQDVKIKVGEQKSLEFQLGPHTLRGGVKLVGKQAAQIGVGEIRIQFEPQFPCDFQYGAYSTSSQDKYIITGLFPGKYRLRMNVVLNTGETSEGDVTQRLGETVEIVGDATHDLTVNADGLSL